MAKLPDDTSETSDWYNFAEILQPDEHVVNSDNENDVDIKINESNEDNQELDEENLEQIEIDSDDFENCESSQTENEDELAENRDGVLRLPGRPKLLRTGKGGRPKKVYNTKKPETLNVLVEDPSSVKDALNSENSIEWKKAMQAEYDALIKNNTWTLVERPTNKSVIGSKWVFSTKYDTNGMVDRFKARLVAQGCSQKQGIDFTETYAPVVRIATIRLILSLSVKYKLLVNHIDVVAAYLNGDLDEEVYMRQPEAFIHPEYNNYVCKLNKSLYGLKQAGRNWVLNVAVQTTVSIS